jgi:hypothetical protein
LCVRENILKSEVKRETMLPYSAVAAIDYAAYQSRPAGGNGGSFAHSWLVPTQEMCGGNFKPNPQNHLVVDPGHVDSLLFFLIFLCFYVARTWELSTRQRFLAFPAAARVVSDVRQWRVKFKSTEQSFISVLSSPEKAFAWWGPKKESKNCNNSRRTRARSEKNNRGRQSGGTERVVSAVITEFSTENE